jgi:hypothetical protein
MTELQFKCDICGGIHETGTVTEIDVEGKNMMKFKYNGLKENGLKENGLKENGLKENGLKENTPIDGVDGTRITMKVVDFGNEVVCRFDICANPWCKNDFSDLIETINKERLEKGEMKVTILQDGVSEATVPEDSPDIDMFLTLQGYLEPEHREVKWELQ